MAGRFRWGVLGRGALVVLPFWAAYLAITLVAAPESVKAADRDLPRACS